MTSTNTYLVLIMAVERSRPYLQRNDFIIRTDHRSLSYLDAQHLHSELQKKAMRKLMGLQFKIIYIKRARIILPPMPCLDRLPHVMSLQAISEVQPLWIQEVLNSYLTDPAA